MSKSIYKIAYKTAKKLYENKKCVYENLDKIEKRVVRINAKLIKSKMLDFSTHAYDEESMAEFFAMLIKIIDFGSITGSNRKLLDNLAKLDWSIDIDDMYIVFITKEYNRESERYKNLKMECSVINYYINEHISNMRTKIRYVNNDYLDGYEQVKNSLDVLLVNKAEKSLLQKMTSFKITEELFSDLFIQTLIYFIANNSNIGISIKEKLLKTIENTINAFKVIKDSNNVYSVFDDFAVKLFYLNRKKELNTEVEVLNRLIKQNKEQYYEKYPLNEFQCNGRIIKILDSQKKYINEFLSKEYPTVDYSLYTVNEYQIELEKVLSQISGKKIYSVLDISQLKRIITEGDEKEKNVRFKEKLDQSWKYCVFLRKYAGRQLHPFYLQHIKVIYREILVDKIKFNNKTTHTIVKDLQERIKKDIDSSKSLGHDSESYFLLEKITRGFYREKGNISMYDQIGNIRIAYYSKILDIYQFKDVEEASVNMKAFIEYIDIAIKEELSKI